MGKTGIVIGATGLVGSEVLDLLLGDDRYSKVKVFHRRSTGIKHPKLEEHIIDFDEIDEWKGLIKGDELYSALGTTIKKAGSQERQYTIDYTYQYETAKAAVENGVLAYALVSSLGANSESGSFYPRIKGELDDSVQKLNFEKTLILRPSFLEGDRDEFRLGERIGIPVAKVICKIPGLKKYHPIKARDVAKAMIEGLNRENNAVVFEGDEIHSLL